YVGTETPVEADLVFASDDPPLEAGKVQEAKIDRLFDLVGEPAGQQHPGDVGFVQTDVVSRMRIGRRLQKRLDKRRQGVTSGRPVHGQDAATSFGSALAEEAGGAGTRTYSRARLRRPCSTA